MTTDDELAHSIARLQILAELRALAAEQDARRRDEDPRSRDGRASRFEPTAPDASRAKHPRAS